MKAFEVYLTFNGNCEKAFNYYKDVFGGEFVMMSRMGEMPEDAGFEVAEDEKDLVMHVTLKTRDGLVLMGSDTSGSYKEYFNEGNNYAISISAESEEEADTLFAALSDGGKVNMPMEHTFWESYFGMVTDQFGIHWMIGA